MYLYNYFLLTFQNGTLCYFQGFGVYFVSGCVFRNISISFFISIANVQIETCVHLAC